MGHRRTVILRLDADQVKGLDAIAKQQGCPSRNPVIRQIIRARLATDKAAKT